ncbi:MADS-box transcription factor 6-like [Gastrolobium bilobum]|uniref:MADS-box transcription factor 6-like n=1 Tax=Gastrolobium bilobum TaxID=150636 RepID=UPI002AAFCBDC|nr:MADS-box transcription factor 6-like [Gastrolobium bilobum]
MDSSSVRKSNIRKGKVEIKKVEEKSKRYVTFSKCKQGLFNKVTELSLLCQAETALVINSQKGKLYACGYPDSDFVIHYYHGGGGGYHNCAAKKASKKDLSIEDISFEQVEKSKNCIEDLKMKLVSVREKKKVDNSLPPLPVALPPLPVASSPMQRLSNVSFLNEGFNGYGV